jgi:putative addiction module CopG family antidote
VGQVTISLPDEVQAFVDQEVSQGAYADRGAYFESLAREDHARKVTALREALEEGERSGASPLSFEDIVERAREEYRSRES